VKVLALYIALLVSGNGGGNQPPHGYELCVIETVRLFTGSGTTVSSEDVDRAFAAAEKNFPEYGREMYWDCIDEARREALSGGFTYEDGEIHADRN